MPPLPPKTPPPSTSKGLAEPTMCGWDGDGQIWVEYSDRVPDESAAIAEGRYLDDSRGWAVAGMEMLGNGFDSDPPAGSGHWYWHLRWVESVAYFPTAVTAVTRGSAALALSPELAAKARSFLTYPGGTILIGMRDAHTALGVEADMERLGKRRRDSLARWYEDALAEVLGLLPGHRVDVRFRTVDCHLVASVRIADDY